MKKNSSDIFIVGTRPDIIKFAPLIKEMNPFVIHTGQHTTLARKMLDVFEIIPDVDLKLMSECDSLSKMLSRSISRIDKIVKQNEFKRIWVHGDTTTALAGALVATTNQIQLVHNEAGLRTHDKKNPYPEEIFRTLIDSMSDIMFAPTTRARKNLINEKVQGDIYIVGNTIIDAIRIAKRKIPNVRPIEEKYVLATVHRRESFGNDLYEIFSALKELSKDIRVVIPAHPNPNVQKIINEVGIEVVKPMNYINFLHHLKYCEYVISDSGGIQEEIPSFHKKIIVLRKTTERQEIIRRGYGVLVDKMEKNHILNIIKEFTKDKIVITPNIFGNAVTKKIIRIINKYDETEKDMRNLNDLEPDDVLRKIMQ